MPSRRPRPPHKRYDAHAARQPNGSGSCYQLPDGSWMAAAFAEEIDGRKHRVYRRGLTRGAALERLGLLVTQIEADTPAVRGDLPLGTYLERWLKDAPNLAPNSRRAYRAHVAALTATLGQRRLDQLTPAQIQRVYADWHAAGVAPATVKARHGVLHKALEQAVRWGLLPRNVSSLADAPRAVPREQVLTAEQTRRLLDAADRRAEPCSALWTLLAANGLRVGEALGLRWQDIDLDGAQLSVRQQARTDRSIGRPKTVAGRRTLLLIPRTVAALRAHRQRQPGSELVFTLDGTRPYSRPYVDRAWQTLLADLALPPVHKHDLRRGLGTFLAAAGINPRVAAAILGHSSSAITLAVYTSVSAEMQEDAAAALAKTLGEAAE